MPTEIPKDRNKTPLSPGDIVKVFLDHSERPDHMAKVLFPGAEQSTLEPEGEKGSEERVDNKNLEVL